ncbi:hypothetical protein QQS21_012475 [Conoideocrella luteorostrata]|uniref:Uncharacterized protein n=1 Tax=Conoideocrella luteorostrata TaxID=1105319 RepID=A0AAJ0FUT4_9HYPO|nr:hypothetical protein QQS21_012475 [Conoideocrella luteorostrata]
MTEQNNESITCMPYHRPRSRSQTPTKPPRLPSKSQQGVHSPTTSTSLTAPPVLADDCQPVDRTKRKRKPTAKVMEMTAVADEDGVEKPTENTENTETKEDPEPRRKRKKVRNKVRNKGNKVLKQDETQLELQQKPTQDCIAVCSITS